MSFFRRFSSSNKEKTRDRSQSRNRSEILSGVQQWPYYRDLAIESGHCTIPSELASLRYSRLNRSLYNLVYTPNDELNYFILYMESCSLSSYLKFILDVHVFEKLTRESQTKNTDQQTSALALFHRYLSIDANYLIPIDDEIRRTTLSLICPSNNSTTPDPHCFRTAREYAWSLIEQDAYPGYLSSAYHVNYQLKMLTSNELQLHDILYNNSSLAYFIEFSEQEKFIDLVRFWLAIEHFYQSTINRMIDSQTLTENALNIYEQYISLQASARLGFDDAIRARVECSICQPEIDAGPSSDTFDQTAWIVYVILQREYFPRFLQSVIFYRHISDLMLKLRNEDTALTSRPIKTIESDTTSINSDNLIQTSSSPLLPTTTTTTQSNRQRNPSVSSSCPSINQDVGIKSKGKFSMGYIDPLGRFIRDPDVDTYDSALSSNRKTTSNPIQFIANLVRNEQEELAQEEAAARFAESFINEITNMTANLDNQ
ncbi:unnamed protein product [Adineta steineri]|uniref:RGS domain-containing protein n=1 Tax=Adineta steineri TaxID=433720 RepID=A0A814THG6_9BILA|nr:unnamed protein product [Adineta steineri]CAF1161452.1 unnamed protein product [Adineta steineri]